MQPITHPFDPIVFNDSRILILGTFPSITSIERKLYYGHPRNQFWKILSTITGYPINNKDQKLWLLKHHRLALWDVVGECERSNSSDSKLTMRRPNNIPALLESHPTINKIAFTGKRAQTLFLQSFPSLQIKSVYLPSPSPAYAAMPFEQKCATYKEELGL